MLASRANVSMVAAFEKCAVNAKFIGEIGLDHSTPKAPQKEEQLWVFNQLLKALGDGNKLVTLHSRGAETVVLNCLRSFNRKPVVFHWFSGSARQLSSVLDDGHYVSLNQAMVRTQKWQELITIVPKDRVLLETDAPHTGNQVIPGQTSDVLKWLGGHWKVPKSSANTQVESNLDRIWPIN
jgi:TatD DNase family protein